MNTLQISLPRYTSGNAIVEGCISEAQWDPIVQRKSPSLCMLVCSGTTLRLSCSLCGLFDITFTSNSMPYTAHREVSLGWYGGVSLQGNLLILVPTAAPVLTFHGLGIRDSLLYISIQCQCHVPQVQQEPKTSLQTRCSKCASSKLRWLKY